MCLLCWKTNSNATRQNEVETEGLTRYFNRPINFTLGGEVVGIIVRIIKYERHPLNIGSEGVIDFAQLDVWNRDACI